MKNSLGSKLVGKEGAEVRAWPGRKLHAKFVVVDATRVLCGSYNWTTSAAGKNLELLLTFADPADVGSFTGMFGQLWEDAPEV